MTTFIQGTRQELAQKAVSIIQQTVSRFLTKADYVVVGIPGGRSVRDIFSLLKTAQLPWQKIHLFWVDERLVPLTHPDSNYKLAKDVFLDKMPPSNIHPMPYLPNNPELAALQYTNNLKDYNGFDIVLLGVGEDGHVAALYPKHHSFLNDYKGYFTLQDSPKPPPARMTASRTLLMRADTVIALLIGEGKREAYQKFMDPAIPMEACPAKFITQVKNSYVLTDL